MRNNQMANEVNINLGIDFGTSYTKVCIWSDSDTILNKPETINLGGEYPNEGMLPDGVYRYGSDDLVSITKPNDTNLKGSYYRGVKVLLKRKSKEKIDQIEGENINQTYNTEFSLEEIENLCAYYLAQVINKSINKAKSQLEEDKVLAELTPKWTANIGVPVEYYDSPILAYFHRVLHLALQLEQKNLDEIKKDEIPYSELEEHLREIRSVYKDQFEMENHLEELSEYELEKHVSRLIARNDHYNTVLPEIESIVRPFIYNPKGVTEGMYFFFDIGGGTVDGTACYLRPSGRELVPEFFHSTVKENGVDTLRYSRELVFQSNLIEQITQIEHSLAVAGKGDYRINSKGGSKEAIEKQLKSKQNKEDKTILKIMLVKLQLQQQVGEVIMRTKNGYNKPELFPKSKLPLIILGGGAKSPFYKETLPETYYSFKQYRADVPEYELGDLDFDSSDLKMKGVSSEYFDRYLIACGLSYPRVIKSNISRSYYKPKKEDQSKHDGDEWRETPNIGTGRLSS